MEGRVPRGGVGPRHGQAELHGMTWPLSEYQRYGRSPGPPKHATRAADLTLDSLPGYVFLRACASFMVGIAPQTVSPRRDLQAGSVARARHLPAWSTWWPRLGSSPRARPNQRTDPEMSKGFQNMAPGPLVGLDRPHGAAPGSFSPTSLINRTTSCVTGSN